MSNVMSKTQQEQVVALGKLGWTTRKIEETTGCRRETVSKYLRLAGVPVRPPGQWGRAPPVFGDGAKPAIEVSTARNASQASLCEAHRADIAAKVDKGVCAKVIWEELTNFSGSYASVKRFVQRLKAETSVSSSIPVATIYTGPGKEAQVDYGQGPLVRDPRTGRLVRSRLFVMTLGWSRKAVYLLSLSSSSEVWCELHEKAFRALGGTPTSIVLDNLAEGVKLPDYCDPALNQQYAHTLKHYSVIAVPARVRDPDRKGKVERGVGYAQLRLEHRTFESLNEAQAHLDNWVATVADVRVHGTTKRVVNEHFVDEKPHLQVLPVEPCRRYTYCRRKVTSTGEVEVSAQRYAAPATHVNAWVQVQHDANVVRLVDEGSGKLLLEHRRHSTTPAGAAAEKAAAKGVTSSPLGNRSPPRSNDRSSEGRGCDLRVGWSTSCLRTPSSKPRLLSAMQRSRNSTDASPRPNGCSTATRRTRRSRRRRTSPARRRTRRSRQGRSPAGSLVTKVSRGRLFRQNVSTSSWRTRSLALAAHAATTASSNSRSVDVIRCSSFPRFDPRSPSTN